MADIKQNGMMVHIICKEYGYMPEPDHLIKIINQRWKATLTHLEITVAEKYADKFLNKGVIYTRRRVRQMDPKLFTYARRTVYRSKEFREEMKKRYYNILMTVPQSEWGNFNRLLERIANIEPKLEYTHPFDLSTLHKQMVDDPEYPGMPRDIVKTVFMPELAKKKRNTLIEILARYEGRQRPYYELIREMAEEEFGVYLDDKFIRNYLNEQNPTRKPYTRPHKEMVHEVLVSEPVPF